MSNFLDNTTEEVTGTTISQTIITSEIGSKLDDVTIIRQNDESEESSYITLRSSQIDVNTDLVNFAGQSTGLHHQDLLEQGAYSHDEIDQHLDNLSNPHQVTKEQIGLGHNQNLKMGTGITDPSFNDDETEGYAVGSHYINTTQWKEFVCLHAETGNAVWRETTVIDHAHLTNTGSFTHPQIDQHLDDSTIHYTQGEIDHQNIQNKGIHSHQEIDQHLDNAATHFTQSQIDHRQIQGQGRFSHLEIDRHLEDSAIHFSKSEIIHQNITDSGTYSHPEIDAHLDNADIHFLPNEIDHQIIRNSGQHIHQDIDQHLDDNIIHFQMHQIEHQHIIGIGMYTHQQIDEHIEDPEKHRAINDFTVSDTSLWSSRRVVKEVDNQNQEFDSHKGQPQGFASLDNDGKIPVNQIPDTATVQVYEVAGLTERDKLTAQEGDFCKVQDAGNNYPKTFIYDGTIWVGIEGSNVVSVNQKTGHVELTSTDIYEGSNLYYTENRVSNNPTVVAHQTDNSNPHQVTKDQVGLANVDNIKNNLNATFPPRSSNDLHSGWVVGSRWHNTHTNREWVCTDNSSNSAIWLEITIDNSQVLVAHMTDSQHHHQINDLGTATTDLWSADHIHGQLENKANLLHNHSVTQIPYFGPAVAGLITAQKGTPSGLAYLDAFGKIPSSQLPSISLTTVTVVPDLATRNALSADEGDVVKVVDNGAGFPQTYIHDGSGWIIIQDSSDVVSVNNQTGVVTLQTSHIPEGSNLYYTNARVSNNPQVSANSSHRQQIDNPHQVTKAQLGLPDIENVKSNLSATTNPTTLHDVSQDYTIGSRWFNTITKEEWVCVDATTNSAVWKKTSIIHHSHMSNIGTHTHSEIDTHLQDSTLHFTQTEIDHQNLVNRGTHTHAQIDTHLDDPTIHFTQIEIDHQNLQNRGTKTHDEIDSHLNDSTIHFTKSSISHQDLQDKGTHSHSQIDAHLNDTTKHFTQTDIDHLNLKNAGTHTHNEIDFHLDDSTIHFTQTEINHLNLQNRGIHVHTEIDYHLDDLNTHFTQGQIDHSNLLNTGTHTHAQIDAHLDNDIKHRTINDTSNSTTALWSAQKISQELAQKSDTSHTHTSSHITDLTATIDNCTDSQKGMANGLATLDSGGKIPGQQIPPLAINNVSVVNDITERDALSPIEGDVCKVIDAGSGNPETYIYDGSDWLVIDPSDAVTSVNGKIGTIVLTTTDLAEGTNLYYTESRVSASVTSNIAHQSRTDNPHQVTKGQVGLSEVVNLKVNLAGISPPNGVSPPNGNHDLSLSYAIGSRWLTGSQEWICLTGSTGSAIWKETTLDLTNALNNHTQDATIHFTQSEIDHTALQNIGAHTHAQIDTHLDDTTIHFAEASIDHQNLQDSGQNTHAQIDTHMADTDTHFTKSSISHLDLQNTGQNTHVQIDAHLANTNNPHQLTKADLGLDLVENLKNNLGATGSPTSTDDVTKGYQLGSRWVENGEEWVCLNSTVSTAVWKKTSIISHQDLQNIGTNSHAQLDSHLADTTLHFTKSSISHQDLQNKGTNTHAQIDSHLADTTHFTKTSISHTDLQDKGTYTHAQIDSHLNDTSLHFTEASINHQNLQNVGTNSHAQIDTHFADASKHRIINDSTSSSTELWSSSKISSELGTKIDTSHTHTKTDIANFDTSVDSRIDVQKGVSGGITQLDFQGKIPTSLLPSLAITDVVVVADISERDALSPVEGDVCKVIDVGSGPATYIYGGSSWIVINDVDAITSVNGQTGIVVLDTGDISEGANLYYTEAHVSANTDVAASTTHRNNTANPHSVTKAQIGLANVENVKVNLNGLQAPTSTDDNTQGYQVCSRWIYGNQEWVCSDSSTNAAIWQETTITDHQGLTNIGTNTHAQIDAHLANIDTHYTKGTISHHEIQDTGTKTHVQIDSHINDLTLHCTQTNIDHKNLQNIGTKTHAQIDTHLNDSSLHFTKASISHNDLQDTGTNTHTEIDTHLADNTIHYAQTAIDHQNLLNRGTNTHAQIDSHITDATTHFTKASINHDSIQNAGTNTHTQIDAHLADTTTHFTKSSIYHNDLQDKGFNTHVQIDAHLADTSKHLTINDSGTATTDLWSASKINTELGTKANSSHTHSISEITDFNASTDARIVLQKGAANGVASLDSSGKIQTGQLPSIAITDVHVVSNIATRNGLLVQRGDVCKVTDAGAGYPQTYIYDGSTWIDIQESSDVISVNGHTGSVTLNTGDITEGSNFYYTVPSLICPIFPTLTPLPKYNLAWTRWIISRTVLARLVPRRLMMGLLKGTKWDLDGSI